MKFLLVAVLVACVSIASIEAKDEKHDMLWGSIGPYDQLLTKEIVHQTSKTLKIVSGDFKWPSNGTDSFKEITAIRATDQGLKGNGGYVTLYAGGVGSRSVTVHLKSQRNHGYNFIIEIYGR